MSTLLLNNHPVIQAEIRMPRVGVANADLLVDSTEDIAGPATLVDDDGEMRLVGRATRNLEFLDSVRLRFVLGAGDLDAVLDPKSYNGYTVRSVVRDILSDTGSTLSATAADDVLNVFLSSWVRLGSQRAKASLQAILDYAGASSWRVLPDGSVWFGAEAWPDSSTDDFEVASRNSAEGWLLIECERPFVLPGQTIILPESAVGSGGERQHVSSVTHIVQPGLVQSRLYLEDAA